MTDSSEKKVAIAASTMIVKSLTSEEWREYDFGGRKYRIEFPVTLVMSSPMGSTHRIVDEDGVVHCVPAPGFHGCVIRWKSKEGYDPVAF